MEEDKPIEYTEYLDKPIEHAGKPIEYIHKDYGNGITAEIPVGIDLSPKPSSYELSDKAEVEFYGIIQNDGYKLLKGFIKKRLNSDSDLAIAVTSEA